MRIGLACLALGSGGWIVDISIPLKEGSVDIGYEGSGDNPLYISSFIFFIGLSLIVIGLIWEVSRYMEERRENQRKKVIVIEARGLRDRVGSALIDAVPSRLKGNRELLTIDLRQRVRDGEIDVPEAVLEKLVSIPDDLRRRENGVNKQDISIVYGGLSPVPFTFLTGVQIDDEGLVEILDWDRYGETWRELDVTDDQKRFRVSGLDKMELDGTKTYHATIAVSVSYKIDIDEVRTRVGDMPVIELYLDDGSPDCHWSGEKQRALGQQFLNAVIDLSNQGVKRIHLFLAAQNSIVFRFGRLYDKRNLPEVIVYQYQKGADEEYPWGVLMPVGGVARPAIVR